jgi:hypothetical protein
MWLFGASNATDDGRRLQMGDAGRRIVRTGPPKGTAKAIGA